MLYPVLNGTLPRLLHVHEVRETKRNVSGSEMVIIQIQGGKEMELRIKNHQTERPSFY